MQVSVNGKIPYQAQELPNSMSFLQICIYFTFNLNTNWLLRKTSIVKQLNAAFKAPFHYIIIDDLQPWMTLTYLCSQICEIPGPMCWLNLHNLTKRTGVKEKYQISTNTHKVLQKWFWPHSNLFAKLKKNGKFSEAKLEHLFDCLYVFCNVYSVS